MVFTRRIEGGGATTTKSTSTPYRPKSSRDTIAPLPAPSPTTTLSPTRTATQDWTVLQQRPDRPVTSITAPPATTKTPVYTPTSTPPPTQPVQPPIQPPPREAEPEAPTGPGGAGGNATADMLDQFTTQEIEAALLALEAQYGMDRESLLQDQSLIGAQYRLLMTRLNRARVQGIEGATNDAVSRGIYRSGILGENVQTIENDYTEQMRAQEEQRLAQEQQIQSQLDFLDANKAAQGAQVQSGLRREQANYLLQAGVSPNPGNGAFVQVPGGVPPAGGGAPGAAGGGIPGSAGGGNVGFPGNEPYQGQSTALQDQYAAALQLLISQNIDPSTPEGAQAFAQVVNQMKAAVGPGNINVGVGSNGGPYSYWQTPSMEGSGQYYTGSVDKAQRTNAANAARIAANPNWYSQEQRLAFGLA